MKSLIVLRLWWWTHSMPCSRSSTNNKPLRRQTIINRIIKIYQFNSKCQIKNGILAIYNINISLVIITGSEKWYQTDSQDRTIGARMQTEWSTVTDFGGIGGKFSTIGPDNPDFSKGSILSTFLNVFFRSFSPMISHFCSSLWTKFAVPLTQSWIKHWETNPPKGWKVYSNIWRIKHFWTRCSLQKRDAILVLEKIVD